MDNSPTPEANWTAKPSSIFEQYAGKLRRFLVYRVGNELDAQDLTQEAYFRLCRVERPDLIRQPDAYLFKIANNLANEFLTKKKKQPTMIDIDHEHSLQDDNNIQDGLRHFECKAEIRELERILADMPPLYSAILLMRKRDGYSHQEIAEKLNISPHTVHSYLKRALAKCRALWVE